MRQELVVTVLTVAGAALGAAAGAGWLGPGLIKAAAAVAGGANAVGLAVWRSRLGRREIDAPSRVAAPGAMFHQIERDVGFEFLKHAVQAVYHHLNGPHFGSLASERTALGRDGLDNADIAA